MKNSTKSINFVNIAKSGQNIFTKLKDWKKWTIDQFCQKGKKWTKFDKLKKYRQNWHNWKKYQIEKGQNS